MVNSLRIAQAALQETCHINVNLGKLAAWSNDGSEQPAGLEQYLRDAINGHEGACQFVSQCWDQDLSLRAQTDEVEMLLEDWDLE